MGEIGSAAFNLMTVYPREAVCRRFESHRRTPEAVIPLGGRGIIIPLAPPGISGGSSFRFLCPGK